MRLFIVLLVLPIISFAQTSGKVKQHDFEVSPFVVNYFSKINWHHQLAYQFSISPFFSMKVESQFTLMRGMDYAAHSELKNYSPLFNNSSLIFKLNKTWGDNQFSPTGKVISTGIHAGYQFSNFGEFEKDGIERVVIAQTDLGLQIIKGYAIHSAKAGLHLEIKNYKTVNGIKGVKFKHTLSLVANIGLKYTTSSLILTENGGTLKGDKLPYDAFRIRTGWDISYQFQHTIYKHLGLIYGIKIGCLPKPHYIPNYEYYFPRGGTYSTLYSSFNIGFSF